MVQSLRNKCRKIFWLDINNVSQLLSPSSVSLIVLCSASREPVAFITSVFPIFHPFLLSFFARPTSNESNRIITDRTILPLHYNNWSCEGTPLQGDTTGSQSLLASLLIPIKNKRDQNHQVRRVGNYNTG